MSKLEFISLYLYWMICLIISNIFQISNYGKEKEAYTLLKLNFPFTDSFLNDLFVSVLVPLMLAMVILLIVLLCKIHRNKYHRSLSFILLGLLSTVITQLLIGFSIVSFSLMTIGSFAGASGSYFDSFRCIMSQVTELKKADDYVKKRLLLSEINYHYSVIITAILAIGAIIGVCMTILWGLSSVDYPYLVKGRISVNLVIGYVFLVLATLIWAIRPLVNCKDQLMDRF